MPCNAMQYYAIPCNSMQYHAIQCIINSCWRSVPLPCGQYKAIFFIKMGVRNLKSDLKVVTLVKALNPWACCVFDNLCQITWLTLCSFPTHTMFTMSLSPVEHSCYPLCNCSCYQRQTKSCFYMFKVKRKYLWFILEKCLLKDFPQGCSSPVLR